MEGWFRYRGQAVGRIEGGTFIRQVRPDAQLRTPPAWALWAGLVDALEAAGVHTVRLEVQGGSVFFAPLGIIRSRGIALDRGQGPQLALLLTDWARLEIRQATPQDVVAVLAGGAS